MESGGRRYGSQDTGNQDIRGDPEGWRGGDEPAGGEAFAACGGCGAGDRRGDGHGARAAHAAAVAQAPVERGVGARGPSFDYAQDEPDLQ